MSAENIVEFVVALLSVQKVIRNQRKIERLFSVIVGYGNIAKDNRAEKQWVTLEGKPSDCAQAKEYIIALCQPDDTITMRYPPESITLSSLETIENQTTAAISVDDVSKSEIRISGTDLAVTLAMSAIEDLIQRTQVREKSQSPGNNDEKSRREKRLSSEAAVRLDTRFERMLSQYSDGSCTPQDYDYASDAVKRAMLQCWSEDDLHKNTDVNLPDILMPIAGISDFHQHSMDQYFTKPYISDQNATSSTSSGTEKKPNAIANLRDQVDVMILTSDKTEPTQGQKAPSDSNGSSFNLREFASQCGYAAEDIESVLSFGPDNMTPKEFLTRLYENKAAKDRKTLIATSDTIPEMKTFNTGSSKSNSEIIASKTESLASNTRRTSSEIVRKKESIDSTTADSPSSDYWQRLARDFQEEDDKTDISELKLRNAERQKLIKSAIHQKNMQWVNDEKVADAAISICSPTQSKSKKKKRKKGPSPRLNGGSPQKGNSPVAASYLVDLTDEAVENSLELSYQYDETCLMKVWQPPSHDFTQPSNQEPQGSYRLHHPGYSDNPALRSHEAGSGASSQLRHVVIDGSNVAMTHGNGKVFSCLGIKICVEYFLNRGHQDVTAFVPQWRQRTATPQYPIGHQELLEELKDRGNLVFTPARKVEGKHIVCYDDRFILRLADETDGIIVSNDNYRDLMNEKPGWKKLIQQRLLMYSFVGDIFMPPDDPLGRDGPTLDDLLCKNSQDCNIYQLGQVQSPNRYASQRGGRQNYRQPYPSRQPQQQNLYPLPTMQQQQQRPWQPKRSKQVAGRSQEETDHLTTILRSFFPNRDQENKIQTVLQNHRAETDINKLSNYVINICK